ncbi:hypothetical protein G7Y89_g3319 [Cudoniella acicularis]|uniref:Sexual development protein n=1 Tax=Cudoniella acicularis TaxID=354080 RepID=A0A8H4RSG8_9HELO|nr:hypothetical protein G7Y89_g3319 [Cudoniella acicularis]
MVSNFVTASLAGFLYLTTVTAAPFSYANNSLSNSFPNSNASQIEHIERKAHGTIPTPFSTVPGSVGKPLSDETLISLEFIAFNELFEVAFFTELIANITTRVSGYTFELGDAKDRDYILKSLNTILAQEEVHALWVNGLLQKSTGSVILPCEYNFLVSDFFEAIALASKFTDANQGVLQDITVLFGTQNDSTLIRSLVAVAGQEGEQNGWFRSLLGKSPSALPFLTANIGDLDYSFLIQEFVVPGSCPNITDNPLTNIPLPIFPPLNILTQNIRPVQQNLEFGFRLPSSGPDPAWKSDYSGLQMTYMNQQNNVTVAPLTNVHTNGDIVTFNAFFPFDEAAFGNGLTIALVTHAGVLFPNQNKVSNATVYGPGMIERQLGIELLLEFRGLRVDRGGS